MTVSPATVEEGAQAKACAANQRARSAMPRRIFGDKVTVQAPDETQKRISAGTQGRDYPRLLQEIGAGGATYIFHPGAIAVWSLGVGCAVCIGSRARPTSERKPNQQADQTIFTRLRDHSFALAFVVEDVERTLAANLDAGGSALGEVVSTDVSDAGHIEFTYARDAEGNIIEIQHWRH